ncbi:uncharacterized protein [Aegilops tauschii subsp. strangulata]|uniref:uncharacterized protein n=1 Tax=Aegilops tauschii subsp. strangulata TaxID=200361 RepID=UPI003CC8712E
MSWNIRGLNTPARHAVVCETAEAHRLAILCLHETKIETWSRPLVKDVGGARLTDCVVLPASGTRGGAAIFWDSSVVDVQSHAIGLFSITARVTLRSTSTTFWLTTVYGPVNDSRKDEFLSEIARTTPPPNDPWLINDDFNLIYKASDKNNSNINRRMMGKFRAAIDAAGLREIRCKNRRFTWSNERDDLTLVNIDKFFCSNAWDTLFPTFLLHAASTSCSDHCPLLLAAATASRRPTRFRFESFWPRFPRFHETVQHAWDRPVASSCAFKRIHVKLDRAAKDLKIWAKGFFSNTRLQLQIANEHRQLSSGELALRKKLKLHVLGLAAIERARKRQASRITWLRAGEARSAFFEAKNNSRRQKNFIHAIHTSDSIVKSHSDKASAIYDHFGSSLGAAPVRDTTIAWSSLNLPSLPAVGLDNPFSEEEVWQAICASPQEKAPGPDGFNRAFFRACWSVIKLDVMAVFHQFYHLAGGDVAASTGQ